MVLYEMEFINPALNSEFRWAVFSIMLCFILSGFKGG